MSQKWVDRGTAIVVLSVYGVACFSPVVVAGISAGPFTHGPVSGLYCVLCGWSDYPIGWLANPLIMGGSVFLALGRPGIAFLCGLFAVTPVGYWSVEWNSRGWWDMLCAGYYLWVSSVGLLLVGGGCIWAHRTIELDRAPPAVAPAV